MRTKIFALVIAGLAAFGSVNAYSAKEKPAAVCADCKDSTKCGACCEAKCTTCNTNCCAMKCCTK